MGVEKLVVHPAFYRRLRHYRDRIRIDDGRPQVAARLVKATQDLVDHLLKNPQRGHPARFEAQDLSDILRAAVPGFTVFALFYRWDGRILTIITLEHTAQDLPSRLATLFPAQGENILPIGGFSAAKGRRFFKGSPRLR